jgi:NAD(P)-dependent dehydrogenase (short-subunit alcohol dehydrogenase family)
MGGSMDVYSHTKLCLTSFAHELHRRLRADISVRVRVNLYDPGPVDSDLAREAPMQLMVEAYLENLVFPHVQDTRSGVYACSMAGCPR